MLKNNKYRKDIWNRKTETENHHSCLYRKIRRDICYVCLFWLWTILSDGIFFCEIMHLFLGCWKLKISVTISAGFWGGDKYETLQMHEAEVTTLKNILFSFSIYFNKKKTFKSATQIKYWCISQRTWRFVTRAEEKFSFFLSNFKIDPTSRFRSDDRKALTHRSNVDCPWIIFRCEITSIYHRKTSQTPMK